MKLFVLVPGFGDPHWDAKVNILRRNVATVASYFQEYVFCIIQYTQNKHLPEDLLEDPHIEVVYDQGILAKNIHTHAPPQRVDRHNPDYVMILLDDVELQTPYDWAHMIALQKQYELDIVSPSLTTSGMSYWNFMVQIKNPSIVATLMTRCELFCYLMTPDAYDTYYDFCDPNNPWTWGMDFILKSHMNLRVAIAHRLGMMHFYSQSTYTNVSKPSPQEDAEKYLAKHNTSWAELYKLPTIYEVILE